MKTYIYKVIAAAAIIFFFCTISILPQGVTTAAINGKVVDQNGEPLPAATIVAVHQPSGTVYGITTRDNGNYNLLGMRVGGPYKVTVSYIGYKTETRDSIWLNLGQSLTLNFRLTATSVQLNEVSVTANRNVVISSDRTGASQRVSAEQIQQIPTISRSLTDLTKLSPLFSATGYSAAGKSGRYNNIQLNGTQFNDLFGLGEGAPGSGEGANAISLDEIQEFQIVIAPFDVRYGGFTGGGINAITRSGTNTFEGSVYGYGRNQGFAGVSPDAKQTKLANFNNYQEGIRLGGPIIKDKLFFFVSGELVQYNYPWQNISLTPQGNDSAASYANQMKNILINKYGFDPGSDQSFNASNPNGKFFSRFDWNINEQNKLTFTYSYLNAESDNDYNSTRNGNNSLSFDSYLYLYHNRTSNGVLQLNSQIGNSMTNELTLGYTTILDDRGPYGTAYPLIQVMQNNFTMYAGPDRYSSANSLNQANVELTDNFTYSTGDHLFTFGTHNEFFSFKNLFIRAFYGYYTFSSLADLEAGTNYTYDRSYSRTSDPYQAAAFSADQYGVYAQDEWSGIQNLKITLGIRFDLPTFPTAIANNDSVSYYFPGYSTTDRPKANVLISPRLGFNYDVNGDRVTQIRGGIGVFSGRIPYVWMSNNYGGTGTYYAETTGKPTVAFNSSFLDPYNQPTAAELGLPVKLTSEIDLVSPNLKMPQVLRFDAAVDRVLPYNFIGTLEFLYSKDINDMSYKLVNLKPQIGTNTYEADRPVFGGTNNGNGNFTNILYLENTTEGYQYNFVAQIQRNIAAGLSLNASYTYGRSLDVNSVESSQANSQMAYNPVAGNPNDPPLETSDYEVRNRIGASVTYTEEFLKDAPTSISLFYNGQSGRPYSLTVYGDVNGDGYNQNDLFYIPKNDADIELGTISNNQYVPNQQMYTDLDNFIANNSYLSSHRGQIFERNAATTPWNNSLDMRIVQTIPTEGHQFEISLDILNILNLINNSWGYYYDLTNPTYTIVSLVGKDPANGRNVYSFSKPANNTPWSADNLLSRWYMQLGVRFTL
jgi:outer membrane receptor protein involved in Fe transport